MWDYDKLFAKGNIIGFKDTKENKLYTNVVYEKEDWMDYFNNSLSYKPKNIVSEIQYIIRLDEHGNVVEKLFDRDKDMEPEPSPMPELKDGMFVTVHSCEDDEDILAFIYNSRVIYQDGDWDEICNIMNEDYSLILEVYSSETLCFKDCEECNLLWRSPNYQSN